MEERCGFTQRAAPNIYQQGVVANRESRAAPEQQPGTHTHKLYHCVIQGSVPDPILPDAVL